jgi:hypothetical protein
MSVSEDYRSAAVRHFRDGNFLFEDRRFPNADQLFGLAAECGLKWALTEVPSDFKKGRTNQPLRVHINVLWHRFPCQSLQRLFPRLAGLLASRWQPFEDWSADQRYWPEGYIDDNTCRRHQNAARRILGAVGLLTLRGKP